MKKLCVAVFLSLVAAGVSAEQGAGWYVGAGLGQTKADVDCTADYSAIFADISCDADDKDSAWKLFAGYQVTRNAAIEFGFVDMGEFTIDGTDSFFGSTRATAEGDGFTITGVGSMPVGTGVDLIGKIGLLMWNVDTTIATSNFGSASEDDSGTDLTFGFGAAINLGRNAALRLEWERFSDVGDDDTTGQSDVDMLSASVLLRL